jgi:urease accessory protein UreH
VSPGVAVRHEPAIRVRGDGSVASVSAGSFEWIVHRRAATVAFLATPLMALGDGEELLVSVELDEGTSLALTTQGPTALLRTGRPAVQRFAVRLAERSHLTLLPWVTIPFPGALSRFEVDVQLADGASFAAWDVLAVGRVGRGERFRFEELRSSWRLEGPEGLMLDDRLTLRGSDREAAETLTAGRTHVGSLYLAGLEEDVLPVDEVRRTLDGALELAGASRPAPRLLVARALDRSADRIEHAFWPAVAACRAAGEAPGLAPEAVARRWF